MAAREKNQRVNRTKPSDPAKRKTPTGYWGDHRLLAAGLFIFTLGIYLPSVNNGFVYDDFVLVVDGESPQSVSDVASVFVERHWRNLPYYRPIPRATMVLQNLLHGHKPGPYHAFNAVLAAIAAVLAYALLRSPGFGIVPPFALLGAALFAAHPIASVTVYPSCSGRETLIPMVFTLAAVAAFIRSGWGWHAVAMITFACALLSKEQAVIIPVLFVLADLTRVSESAPGRRASRWAMRYAPVVIVVVVYMVIRSVLFGGGNEHRLVLDKHPLGPLLSVAYTLQTIFVPFVQLIYEPRQETWVSAWRLAAAGVASLVLVCGVLRTRASSGRAALFWHGWFLVSLAPTANILYQETKYAERYGFVALLAVIAVTGAVMSGLRRHRPLRYWAQGLCLGLLLVCVAITVHRGTYYRTNMGFLHHWAETDPNAFQPHASLGEHYGKAQQFDLAVQHHRKALELRPYDPKRLSDLAYALHHAGHIDEAMELYHAALRKRPSFVQARANYGALLRSQGRTSEAIEQFLEAIKYDPDYYRAYVYLGNAHFSRGEFDETVTQYEQALRLRPRSSQANSAMGAALMRAGRSQEAVAYIRKALALDPNSVFAQYNLGMLLLKKGDAEQAADAFRRTLKLDPKHTYARPRLQEAMQLLDREG